MQVSTVSEVASAKVAVAVNESGIAWKSDRSKKFGSFEAENFNVDPAERGGGTIKGLDSSIRSRRQGCCTLYTMLDRHALRSKE